MVGESHRRHGKLEICHILNALVQTEAAADKEGQLRLSRNCQLFQLFGKIFTGEKLAFDAHGDHRAALGKLFADSGSLLRKGTLHIAIRGSLRQAEFGQLHDLDLTMAAKALDIFCRSLCIEFFLQLTDA